MFYSWRRSVYRGYRNEVVNDVLVAQMNRGFNDNNIRTDSCKKCLWERRQGQGYNHCFGTIFINLVMSKKRKIIRFKQIQCFPLTDWSEALGLKADSSPSSMFLSNGSFRTSTMFPDQPTFHPVDNGNNYICEESWPPGETVKMTDKAWDRQTDRQTNTYHVPRSTHFSSNWQRQ